ncbi:MAG: hypothetical protein AB1583_11795 [Bacteroidota bacterium]
MLRNSKGCILFFALVIFLPSYFSFTISAQTIIKGKVTDTDGNPLSNLHVTIQRQGSVSILGFDITKADGSFIIISKTSLDTLVLKISSLAYQDFTIKIPNHSQELSINLKPEPKELKEITIKAQRVVKKGDTLSHLVAPYARKQDRTIADVLQRMPGIEVESSGRILYEGKAVSGVYVEGKNLLEQQYGILTQNLPHDKVATVEIIQNYEPVKILRDYSTSDKVILNFRLKNQVTLTGNASLAGGTPWLSYDLNIVPILFQPGLQSLFGVMANNTGKIYNIGKSYLNFDENRYDNPPKLMSPTPSGMPVLNIPADKYIDNSSFKFSGNVLTKLNNNWDLRLAYNRLIDKVNYSWDNVSNYYLPSDTLTFTEMNRFTSKNYNDDLKLNLKRNSDNFYSDNNIGIEWASLLQNGYKNRNNKLMNETYTSKPSNFFWNARYIFIVRKYPVEIYSYINHDRISDQTQKLSPGFLLLNAEPDSAKQTYGADRWSFETYTSFYAARNNFSFSLRAGISYQKYIINSDFKVLDTNFLINENDYLLKNDIKLSHLRNYFLPTVVYRTRNIWASVYAPVDLLIRKIDNLYEDISKVQNSVFVEPVFSFRYEFNGNMKLSGSVKRNYNLYDLFDYTTGYILRSPDFFVRNLTSPSKQIYPDNSLSLSLKYSEINTGITSQFSGSYSLQELNYITSDSLDRTGMHHLVVKELNHLRERGMLLFGISKYLPEAHLNFKLIVSGQFIKGKFIMSGFMTDSRNWVYTLNPLLSFYSDWFDFTWNLNWNKLLINNNLESGPSSISYLNQQFSFFKDFNDLGKTSINLTHYRLKSDDYFLLGAEFRYLIRSIKKYKVETGLLFNNILSQDFYRISELSTFYNSLTTIPLRAPQYMLFLRFNY